MADDIPEQVYLNATKANDDAMYPHPPPPKGVAVNDPGFRAVVASAYRAGQAAAPGRLSALERDVVEKAKVWRRWLIAVDSPYEGEMPLAAAVDALADPKEDP